jgi:hypothetical protein
MVAHGLESWRTCLLPGSGAGSVRPEEGVCLIANTAEISSCQGRNRRLVRMSGRALDLKSLTLNDLRVHESARDRTPGASCFGPAVQRFAHDGLRRLNEGGCPWLYVGGGAILSLPVPLSGAVGELFGAL